MTRLIELKNLLFFKKLHLILIWFLILSGINVNIDHFYVSFNENIDNVLVYLSSTFRLYIQFFILFFLLFLNFKENLKLNELNYFFYIFFFYNLIQIVSLFLSENNNLNIIYNICSINVLLFLNLIFYREKQDIKKIFYFLILILFIVYTWFYLENIHSLI